MALARILLSIFLVSAFGVANAQSIIFNTEEWYPYSYTDEDGTLKGTAVDVVKAVIEEMDMNPVIAVNSRARVRTIELCLVMEIALFRLR